VIGQTDQGERDMRQMIADTKTAASSFHEMIIQTDEKSADCR